MRECISLRIVRIRKPDRPCELFYRVRVAVERVPTVRALRAVVASQSARPRQLGIRRTLTGIDAHRQQLVVPVQSQTGDPIQTTDESVDFNGTQILTAEVVQTQNHRPTAEVVSEPYWCGVLVTEPEVQRHRASRQLLNLDGRDLIWSELAGGQR